MGNTCGIKALHFGTKNASDDVFVLHNKGRKGIIDTVGVRLKGMTVLDIKGTDNSGRRVDLIRTMPSYRQSVGWIGNDERRTWGSAMFGAYICPVQNRVKAIEKYGDGMRTIKINGHTQVIPVDADGVMLHGLGLHGYGSLLEWKIVDVNLNTCNNSAAITATATIPETEWFSTIQLFQTISLTDGVLGRSTYPSNPGNVPTFFSDTDHAYFKIPKGQKRSEVMISLAGDSFIRTKTDPFVKGETLLPVFKPNPFIDRQETPFDDLFCGPLKDRVLGDKFLDHCIIRLREEQMPGNTDFRQYAARAFYPSAGWGVEVSTPFPKDFPLIHALQVYAPPKSSNPLAANAICFEFAPCVTDPFNPGWRKFPVTKERGFNPAGMWILKPGETTLRTSVRQIRMIDKLQND
ncbi:MAG: hypothetical protein NTZ10_04410 [Candidatus Saganbacteria bacterium]|nr:hypothetical protein [Candidatus Saganbacteria bacterium]